MKHSLLQQFNIKENSAYSNIKDYDVFSDKELLDTLRVKIIDNLIKQNISKDNITDEIVEQIINNTIQGYDLTNLERSHLYNLIDDEINGYGPLNELLRDDNISEIMVNSPKDIYIEIDGKIIKDESVSFINDEHIIRTIQKLLQAVNKTIDHTHPMIDSRLKDGSRVNAIIPPLSVNGPIITIRKYQRNFDSIDDWVRTGSLTPWMATFLQAAVKGKLNILICGPASSGKTTLLNILSSFIDDEERIITIEDIATLNLKQKHVISLEASSNNEKDVSIKELVNNALHMRPDRIIVGEVRSDEAYDMLQAMNTGHEGSLTTMHASSCIDALNRLETLVLLSGLKIPVNVVREYIARAIDLVVYVEKLSDGKRKITHISEITGVVNDEIKLEDIFLFEQKEKLDKDEVSGEYSLIVRQPIVYRKIKNRGIDDLDSMLANLPSENNNYNNLDF